MSRKQALESLLDQAELVRSGFALNQGELSLFRSALQMDGFPEVVKWVKFRLGRDLFTTLEEIEAMERDSVRGDRSELLVQCSLILELAMSYTYLLDAQYLIRQPSIFFDHCRTLEEIVDLRLRLDFVKPGSEFYEILDCEVAVAVRESLKKNVPTWLGIVLIFRASTAYNSGLFRSFNEFLGNESFEIPALAATLLLSLISDVIQNGGCPGSEEVAIRLLKIGASPMVSVEDHRSLFETLFKAHLRPEQQRCRPEDGELEPSTARRDQTALKRLLSSRISTKLKLALEQSSCCTLDSSHDCNKVFPKKLRSLKCIAAQHVGESELAALSGRLKFFTSKHLRSRM